MRIDPGTPLPHDLNRPGHRPHRFSAVADLDWCLPAVLLKGAKMKIANVLVLLVVSVQGNHLRV